jgi:FSR family fosmidomycin resistance protein-like MFS transporter
MVTYVPLYFSARGEGAFAVGKLLSLFLISGAVGTLIAGPLSDRIGHKRFLTVSMGVLCPLIMLFLRSSGPVSIVILAAIGMCLSPMFSVTLVIAQSLMRGRLGVTAGLMTGLGIGAGGLGVTGLGMVADAWRRNHHEGCQRPPPAAVEHCVAVAIGLDDKRGTRARVASSDGEVRAKQVLPVPT